MKQNILFGMLLIGLSLQSCQEKTTADKLPTAIKQSFEKHVGAVQNVNWEENPEYYFANFTENGEKGMAIFRKDDNSWIETDKALNIKDLSPEQLQTLNNYHLRKIKSLKEVQSPDGTDVIKATGD
ncbi:MAG: hypothetical protein ACK4GN_04940 [Runella sp.]